MGESTTSTDASDRAVNEEHRETVTVHVWEGPSYANADALVQEEDPDVYELPPVDPFRPELLDDNQKVMLASNIDNHRTYAFLVPNESRPATLNVYTNDSYHDPHDWGDPIERGLTFHVEDDREPFKCESWGRIMMHIEPVPIE